MPRVGCNHTPLEYLTQMEKFSGLIIYIKPIRFHVCNIITDTIFTQFKKKKIFTFPGVQPSLHSLEPAKPFQGQVFKLCSKNRALSHKFRPAFPLPSSRGCPPPGPWDSRFFLCGSPALALNPREKTYNFRSIEKTLFIDWMFPPQQLQFPLTDSSGSNSKH